MPAFHHSYSVRQCQELSGRACDADGSDTPRLLHVLRPLPAQVLLAHVLPAHALNAELAPVRATASSARPVRVTRLSAARLRFHLCLHLFSAFRRTWRGDAIRKVGLTEFHVGELPPPAPHSAFSRSCRGCRRRRPAQLQRFFC